MKRIMVILLVVALVLGLVACQSDQTTTTQGGTTTTAKDNVTTTTSKDNATTGSSADGSILNPPGQLPIVKEGNELTLTMFMQGIGQQVSSYAYEDNDFTRKVVDETGIKLEFVSVSDADATAKLAALLNSNDYPELIRPAFFTNNNDMDYYAQQGIYIPLDEYNLESYPNIAAAYTEYPDLMNFTKGSDGKIYALPEVNDCLHCVYSGGRMWYYMPFVRDNGLKVPQTTDELLVYLKYIRDNDVNGNGKKDEIPLAFYAGQTRNFISIFAKSFLPWVQSNQIYGLALQGGKVTEQYKSEEFRDALRYMKTLYDEGLISKDSFSMTGDQLRELGESPDGPTIAVAATSWSEVVKKAGESLRWYEYFILPNVAGPDGSRYSGQQAAYSVFYLGMFITDKCKNPEAAIALYDYFCNFEVQIDGFIGPKGEAWVDPTPGVKSLMGGESKYKLLVTFGAQRENSSWNQLNPMIRNSAFRLGEEATDYANVEKFLATGDPTLIASMATNGSFNEINNYLYTKNGSMPWPMPADVFLPALIYAEADNTRIADINAVLDPYLDQTFVAFITGTRDIETEWDSYLQELDTMGSAEKVTIMQKTYDLIPK